MHLLIHLLKMPSDILAGYAHDASHHAYTQPLGARRATAKPNGQWLTNLYHV